MKVLFALIVSTHIYYGNVITRVGVYVRKDQCELQAKVIKNWYDDPGIYTLCIPVNG